jgi:hypothetical protein
MQTEDPFQCSEQPKLFPNLVKVKLSLCLAKHYALKVFGGVEV